MDYRLDETQLHHRPVTGRLRVVRIGGGLFAITTSSYKPTKEKTSARTQGFFSFRWRPGRSRPRFGVSNFHLDTLRPIFVSVCTDFESGLIEFEGEDDHVHLPVNYPPKVAVSKPVKSLKGISSLMIRKKNGPNIRKKLWGGALWSPSYFAGSCGGAPISVICKYIKQPQAPR